MSCFSFYYVSSCSQICEYHKMTTLMRRQLLRGIHRKRSNIYVIIHRKQENDMSLPLRENDSGRPNRNVRYAKRTFLERRITIQVLRTYISRQVYSASLGIRGRRIQSADRFFRDTAVTKQIICNQFLNFGILDANLYHHNLYTILIASYIMYYYILV